MPQIPLSPSQQAKNLWRDSFALGSISEAIGHLEKVSAEIIRDRTLYEPLWTAFVISYSRPFTKNNDIGKIPTRIIPENLSWLHDAILASRNAILGHTDPHKRSDDGFQVNRMRFRILQSHIIPQPTRLYPDPQILPQALELANKVYENLGVIVAELWSKFPEAENLGDGDYIFDYTLPPGKMFSKKRSN